MTTTLSPSQLSELRKRLDDAEVYRYGFASIAEGVDEKNVRLYEDWLAAGRHGEMNYLEKYDDIRRDPRLLLPGAESLISCAFSYFNPVPDLPLKWALYALGDDYHEVIRERLGKVAEWISDTTGAQCRVCVDTAPLRERYWAVRAGVGFTGLNNQLIVPGAGSYFFLGEIITTLSLPPDAPCTLSCGDCGRCVAACPGKALDGSGGMDARRCLSYLTIEYKGELPADLELDGRIYGCDECQRACPHNATPPRSRIAEFSPREKLFELDAGRIAAMNQEEFSTLFRRSAIKRTRLSGLRRNAACLGRSSSDDN